jgi:hypothetical protein
MSYNSFDVNNYLFMKQSGDCVTPDYTKYVLLRLSESTMPVGIDPSELIDFIHTKYVDKSVEYLIVRETGENDDNPHYHFAFSLIGTVQALRQSLLRKGIKGKNSYRLESAKPEKMHEQWVYLCKGLTSTKESDIDVKFRHPHFDDVVLKKLHEWFYQKAVDLMKGKTKRKRERPAAEQILEICRDKITHSKKIALSEDEIIDTVFEWYAKQKYQMNTYQMKGQITWISYNLGTDPKTGKHYDSNRVTLAKMACKFQ